MLHFNTVEPSTLAILNRLMALSELNNFYLVGGTALSLQYGHRISVDIDLFCAEKFDNEIILRTLEKEFGKALEYEGGFTRFGIFCFINNVKVDIVHYPHKIIFDISLIDGIRMYSKKEISAMKIQAILGRGKKKDFWDMAELLQDFSIKEIISFHHQKYPSQQLLISIPQAITYFADADESEDPISLKGQTWESVQKIIQRHVNEYLK
jgi:predicted nucleotidyltransferase component of viral defense system